jgi:hypothetical protein
MSQIEDDDYYVHGGWMDFNAPFPCTTDTGTLPISHTYFSIPNWLPKSSKHEKYIPAWHIAKSYKSTNSKHKQWWEFWK